MHGFEVKVKKKNRNAELNQLKCWDAWLTLLGFLHL